MENDVTVNKGIPELKGKDSTRTREKQPRVALFSEVATALGREILHGTYAVGSLLPHEGVLLGQFGVSRPVLREAVKLLEAKGMVKGRQRLGTVVLPSSSWNLLDAEILGWIVRFGSDPDILLKLTEVRMIVEPGACRIAALNARPEDVREMDHAWQRMRGNTEDAARFRSADCDFHRAVLAATHNEYLAAVGSAIATGIEMTIEHTNGTPEQNTATLEPHRRILEAIRSGDASRAAFESVQQLLDTKRLLEGLTPDASSGSAVARGLDSYTGESATRVPLSSRRRAAGPTPEPPDSERQ